MSNDDEPQFGLLMPFVVCEDQGGPYNAKAFVAGWECGVIDTTLRFIAPMGGTFQRWVDPGILPQLDLIAMKHGYSTVNEPWDEHPDKWTQIRFVPPHEAEGENE